jgi:DNA-directed RNA polymerase specialized sigma24 family protein
MTDLDLHLSAIVAGDSDAFGRWIAGAEPSLRSCLRPFAARADTEAVLQEALLRIWQVAQRVEPDGRPNALLRFGIRVAQNVARSQARRLRPELAEDPARFEAAAEQALTVSEPDPSLRARLQKCLEKLPGKPALAIRARMMGAGSADTDLAAELGMRLNTFLQNVTRARRLLEGCLARAGVVLAEVLR